MSYKLPKQKKTPACQQCRQRKIGCDRAKPRCGNCVKRNREECIYPEKKYGTVKTYSDNHMNQYNIHNTTNHNVNHYNHTLIATPTFSNGDFVTNSMGSHMKNIGSLNSTPPNYFDFISNNNSIDTNIHIQNYYDTFSKNTPGNNTPLQTKNYNQESFIPPKYNTQSQNYQFNVIRINDKYEQQTDIEPVDRIELNESLLVDNETTPNKRNKRNSVTTDANEIQLMDAVNQEIDNRVRLLNANLNALPSLFNPTNVSNIYNTKYISTTHPNKNKKSQQNNKKSNELEDHFISNQSTPVFYDLMTSIYSQEEILLKEMDFLRDRYIQLLYHKSKYFNGDAITTTASFNKNSEPKLESTENQNESNSLKRRKIEKSDSNLISSNNIKAYRNKIKENKILLTILGPYEDLDITNGNAQNTKFPPTISNYLNITRLDLNMTNLMSKNQNSKLDRNFIIPRDRYLMNFYEDLIKILKTDFIPNLNEYSRSKFKIRNICNTVSNYQYRDSYTFDYLKLLKINLILEILDISCKIMPNLSKIFYPILDFKISNWMVKVMKLLNDSIEISSDMIQLPMKTMDSKDLSFIGTIIIIILFFYYSRKFNINKNRNMNKNRNNKPSYSKLITSIEQNRYALFYSLFTIKERLIKQINTDYNESTMKNILRFLSLYELLNQIKYDNPMSIDSIDCNEDIIISLKLSINNNNNNKISKWKELKSYWKFISSNYLKQKIFEGEVPIMLVNSIPSMSYYEDKKNHQYIGYPYSNDVNDIDTYNFYVSQLNIINYLYMNDNESSVERTIDKLNDLIRDMDDKYYKFMNQPKADTNFSLLNESFYNYEFKGLQRIDNSLQYYKMKLHLEYLIFLQLEMSKENKYIVNQFNKLFETVFVPIILLIFPSIHRDDINAEIKDDEETVDADTNDSKDKQVNENLDSNDRDVEEDSEYEFKFIKRKMHLLEDLLDILYSIYERFQNYENYQKCKINGSMTGNASEQDTDLYKCLITLNQNFKHLFVVLYLILTSSPVNDKFNHMENFKPATKLFIILNRIGYEEEIKNKLLSDQSLQKDKVTGTLLCENNNKIENKYMTITQQEYLTAIQNSNNGLRSIIYVNSLGRYGKHLKNLDHKLINTYQLNNLIDLDSWFNTNIKSDKDKEIDLSGYNITPQNVTKVFDVFFPSI